MLVLQSLRLERQLRTSDCASCRRVERVDDGHGSSALVGQMNESDVLAIAASRAQYGAVGADETSTEA